MTCTDINFDNCKHFQDLADNATKEAVKKFILNECPWKDKMLYLYVLTRGFPPISITELTAKDFLDMESYWCNPQTKGPVINFIVYSLANGYNNDPILMRLIEHKECLLNMIQHIENLKFLLTDCNYECYKSSPLYEQKNESSFFATYTFKLNSTEYIPKDYLTIINDYIEDIKFNKPICTQTKYKHLTSINNICDFLFNKKNNTIDRESVLGCLKHFKTNLSSSNAQKSQAFLDMLILLLNNNLIHDEHIKKLVEICTNRETHPSYDMIMKILDLTHPEYWVCYRNKTNQGLFTIYINHHSSEIRKIIEDFILYAYNSVRYQSLSIFCELFEDSLENINIEQPSDFNYTSFVQQINYFAKKYNLTDGHRNPIAFIVAFYLYLANNINSNIFEQEGYPTALLYRPHIGIEVLQGYKVIFYNQLENVPKYDKWLICYKKYEQNDFYDIKAVNFTAYNSEIYKYWIKHYVWKSGVQIETKINQSRLLEDGLNALYDIKKGKLFTLFTNPGKEDTITCGDAAFLKNYYSNKFSNRRSYSNSIVSLRTLLHHVSENKLGIIEPNFFYFFTASRKEDESNSCPIPNEELSQLSLLIKEKSQEDIRCDIYSSIFFLALETEFRSSQILSLKRDCLHETSKKGEYVIISETKTSANELVEQPISSYVEREIRHVLQITEEYRSKCSDKRLMNRLFITPSNKKGIITPVSASEFKRFLKKCCSELSLPPYTFENLRDTHMTKAEEYKIRNQLSDMEQTVLTGHKSIETDDKYYVKLNIREMLETLHGVIIGEVNLDGKIYDALDDNIANNENEVSNGCGWCSSNSCDMMLSLDCIMCKNFVTTISRLPYFEDQVKYLDRKIEASTLSHDKEDYMNIKRLTLKYIEEILIKKEAVFNECK